MLPYILHSVFLKGSFINGSVLPSVLPPIRRRSRFEISNITLFVWDNLTSVSERYIFAVRD